MISYLSGKIILKKEKFIIIDVNGVGYKIFLAVDKMALICVKKDVSLFCHLKVKNDSWDLYGFFTFEELEFFEFLLGVSGIGPKAALEISTLGSLDKFKKAVEDEDEKVLEKLFLSGKKKAQAVIFEISRKIKTKEKKCKKDDEAVQALLKLGFSRKESKEAIENINDKDLKTEDKIKEALKNLNNAKFS